MFNWGGRRLGVHLKFTWVGQLKDTKISGRCREAHRWEINKKHACDWNVWVNVDFLIWRVCDYDVKKVIDGSEHKIERRNTKVVECRREKPFSEMIMFCSARSTHTLIIAAEQGFITATETAYAVSETLQNASIRPVRCLEPTSDD